MRFANAAAAAVNVPEENFLAGDEYRLGHGRYLRIASEALPVCDETRGDHACGGDGDRREQRCRKICKTEPRCGQERRRCPSGESINVAQ